MQTQDLQNYMAMDEMYLTDYDFYGFEELGQDVELVDIQVPLEDFELLSRIVENDTLN